MVLGSPPGKRWRLTCPSWGLGIERLTAGTGKQGTASDDTEGIVSAEATKYG